MAELKTKPTKASVKDYIASRANAQQSADCKALMAMLKKITGKVPKMWGPSIVGYGSQRYTKKGGRTDEMPLAAFAIRGRDIVLYVYADGKEQKLLLSRLGKHKMGGVCLHIRHLADVDLPTLEKLVVGSMAEFQQRYDLSA